MQTTITNQEYATRRARVLDAIGDEAVALIQGGAKERGHDKFRQTNDFHYLCGVAVPHAYLLLDGGDRSSTLFLPYQSADAKAREGDLLSADTPQEVIAATGVDRVGGLDELTRALEKAHCIYTPMRQGEGPGMSWDTLQRGQQERTADPWDGRPDRMRRLVGLLRERQPGAGLVDLGSLLDAMRLIKSETEIVLLREAGRITGVAVTEVMKATEPGVMEYQLDAVLRYVYLACGARDAGYRAIIAGGENAWYAHYNANDSELSDGSLVLVDCAPDYHYYTSDIGRMIPVNGKYSDDQRQLYGFMVAYHKTFLELLGPGEDELRITGEASTRMEKLVNTTKWNKPIYEAAARRALGFPNHLSHPVGMAVHDVGQYRGGTLHPGLVLTVDPQLWVPEERLYVRVEDTVVITDSSIENLTATAPLELDAVEGVMKKKGLLQSFPASCLGSA